jgi:hypothetical protein
MYYCKVHVLLYVFPRDAVKILVQANTLEWREKRGHQCLGKEGHLASILTELYNAHHAIIKPHQIALFDDDKDNVDIATRFGHWAFEVPEDMSYDTFEQFFHMLNSKQIVRPDYT